MTVRAAMNAYSVELNDTELRVAHGSEIVVRSPAYITVDNDTVRIGEQARRQAHLHPQKTHNRFWSNLNQNDLQTIGGQFRHHADLAYAHLVEVYQQAGKPDEIFFSIPGSFSDEQLSLLLGIVDACPFSALGLVDSAVAAASGITRPGNYQHLDIELHRSVVTRLGINDEVVRQGVEVIDNTSLCSVYDTAAEFITDTLISQCRFDPLRQAETEQALYDQLPLCLDALAANRETVFAIQFEGVKHQARLTRDLMLQRLTRHYQAIQQELDPACSYLVSDRLARLPGFALQLQAALMLDEQCVFQGTLGHAAAIHTAGPALDFVTRLTLAAKPGISSPQPVGKARTTSTTTVPAAASHLLCEHSAYELSEQPLYLSQQVPAATTHSGVSMCSVALLDSVPVLTMESDDPVMVNGEQVESTRRLVTGDQIRLGSNDTVYTLITVVHGHGQQKT